MNQELRKKIDKALMETFVGNFLFSEEEQNEMLEELSGLFRSVCNSWGAFLEDSQLKLAFVTIVNLTKKWNSNENTWLDVLYKKLLGRQFLENESTGKAYRLIQKAYETVTEKYKVFCFK